MLSGVSRFGWGDSGKLRFLRANTKELHFNAAADITISDNRAMGIACYHPGYTLVEKLQTIVTKFRGEQGGSDGKPKVNFMRQYYDIYKLLQREDIQKFIATQEYHDHKAGWFPKVDLDKPLAEKEAFLLTDKKKREDFRNRYTATSGLYVRTVQK